MLSDERAVLKCSLLRDSFSLSFCFFLRRLYIHTSGKGSRVSLSARSAVQNKAHPLPPRQAPPPPLPPVPCDRRRPSDPWRTPGEPDSPARSSADPAWVITPSTTTTSSVKPRLAPPRPARSTPGPPAGVYLG